MIRFITLAAVVGSIAFSDIDLWIALPLAAVFGVLLGPEPKVVDDDQMRIDN